MRDFRHVVEMAARLDHDHPFLLHTCPLVGACRQGPSDIGDLLANPNALYSSALRCDRLA
jgi:hypothetical protein